MSDPATKLPPLSRTDEMRKMMDATIPFAELFERSKDDKAMIVGSEVREVVGAYRRCLSKLGDQEDQLSLALELLKVANECMAEAFEGKSVSPTMAVMFIRKLDASGLLGEIGGKR